MRGESYSQEHQDAAREDHEEREMIGMVYSQVIAYCRAESQVDIDDPAFIELAVKVQEQIAKRLEVDMWAVLNPRMANIERPKCGCRFVHTCNQVT